MKCRTEKIGTNVDCNPNDFENKLSIKEGIEMIVVGPEDPLVNGIYDFFKNQSELETSQLLDRLKRVQGLKAANILQKNLWKGMLFQLQNTSLLIKKI